MKTKRTNYLGAIILMLAGAAGVFGVGYYVASTPKAQHVSDELRREPVKQSSHRNSAPEVTTEVRHDQSHTKATVLVPKSTGSDLTFTTSVEDVPTGVEPIVFAVNRYLANTGFVPKKARAIAVDVREKVAYIDVTEAFQQSYGSLDERTIIEGLSRTLGYFPNVDKLQFLISGKAVETLGNVDLTEPIDVIRPGEASTQTEG